MQAHLELLRRIDESVNRVDELRDHKIQGGCDRIIQLLNQMPPLTSQIVPLDYQQMQLVWQGLPLKGEMEATIGGLWQQMAELQVMMFES